uniref:Secreted protein n=1 Tax=Karlodinium veneficum TaxID=407301 RepID=A7WQ20_KARVE|nr:unknown [Karlodinium veneficum]
MQLWNLSLLILNLLVAARGDRSAPCCEVCESGKEHYYSIPSPDEPNAQCGETCMMPSRFKFWKLFEPKLSKGTCASKGFTKYVSTETDGVWPLANTNDRYVQGNSSLEVVKTPRIVV